MSRGPKFCPTPDKPDLLDLQIGIKDFARKLKVKKFFENTPSNNREDLVARGSNFTPKPSSDSIFNSEVQKINNLAEKLKPQKPKYYNISRVEREAMISLKNDKDIVIKTVDKGSAFVVMDTSYYMEHVQNRLSNTDLYKKHRNSIDHTIMNRIMTFSDKYKAHLTKKEKLYITKFQYKTANFVAYPKIHKSKIITEEIEKSTSTYLFIDRALDITWRYVIAGPSCPTSRLSELLDILLKPYLQKIPSYIKDYSDFLSKLTVPYSDENNILLVTCDVKDMYSNIETELGLSAVRYFVSKYPELLNPRFSVEMLLEALELVLSNCTFQFNNEFYSLQRGTATGTQVAPTYANITMAYLEISLYKKVKEKFGENAHNYVVKNWKRFLDDGYISWNKTFGEINDFIFILNTLSNNIQFTHEQSDEKIPFLNLMLYKEGGEIKTDIYYKKTDSHDYLPFNSSHPRHTKINVPSTLARMVCQIVVDPQRKAMRLQELKTWLLCSGYKPSLITNCIHKYCDMDYRELRKKVVTENNKEKIVFVGTHNPNNPHVYGKLRSIFQDIIEHEGEGGGFKNCIMIKSEKQPPNLSRIFQKSFFSTKPPPKWGTTKCLAKRCGTCKVLVETDHILFNPADKIFKIMSNFDCRSGNLIYKITCRGCLEFYIGVTVNLRNRVSGHKHKLNEVENIQKIYHHISICAKDCDPPFNIVPFYKIKTDTDIARYTIEDHFIRKYKPKLNTYIQTRYRCVQFAT